MPVRTLGHFLAPLRCGPIDLFTLAGSTPDIEHGLDSLLGAPALRDADAHVYATGANGYLQHWFWDGGGWAHHETTGNAILGSPTTTVMEAPHVFATGVNRRLLHWWWSGDDWNYQEFTEAY